MIPTTFNGAPAWLLNCGPNENRLGTVSLKVPVNRTRTLTGREVRRALGETLQVALKWDCYLPAPQARAARAAALALADELMLCPAWPFVATGAAYDTGGWFINGGYSIGWQADWSSWAINPTTPASWDYVAPLLVGRLRSMPKLTSERADTATTTWEFQEDSPASDALAVPALDLDPEATPAWSALRFGPALADGARPPVFPFPLDWDRSPEDSVAYDVSRTTLQTGSRRQATTYFPQVAERTARGRVSLLSRSDITGLCAWWLALRGSAGSHYVPTGARAAVLSAGPASGATVLAVAAGSFLSGTQFVQLSLPGRVSEIARVTASTSTTVTLSAGLAQAWPAETEVSSVLLGRHLGDSIDITCETPELAVASVDWREVPAEVAPTTDERGVTIGRLGGSRWLYQLEADYAGATVTERFTSAEGDVSAASHVWTARVCSHDRIEQSLSLEQDGTSLKMEWWGGAAQAALLPAHAYEARVRLTIFELPPIGDLAQRWKGSLERAAWQGPVVTASFTGINGLFDRKLPQTMLSPACSARMFDTRCGLVAGDWTRVGAVSGYTAGSRTLTIGISDPGTALSGHDGFAFGYLQYTVSGTPRRIGISSNTAWGSGSLTAYLDRVVPADLTVGTTVSLVPGCVGRLTDCQRFSNQARFRGFPQVPTSNPSFTPLKKDTASGAKK